MRKTPPKRISDKRLKANGGKVPFSSITSPRTPIAKGGKPIPRVNPGKLAKRVKRRRQNHAAYRASETFTVVEQRAAGRCEGSLLWERLPGDGEVQVGIVEIRDSLEWMAFSHYVRCAHQGGLQHHHRTYFRFGGRELPQDIVALCKRCHEWIERVNHPTRRNGR